MPILEILAGIGLAGLLPQLNSIVEFWRSTDCYISCAARRAMELKDHFIRADKDFIVNEELIDDIVLKLKCAQFGITVIAAPLGSGKSTLLRMAIETIQTSDHKHKIKLIRNGNYVLQAQILHLCLNIPQGRRLSQFLPENSIIILDRLNNKNESTDDMCSYLTAFAQDSYMSKKYKIVVCISDATSAKKIIACDPVIITRLYTSIKFVWSKEQADQYVDKSNWFKNIQSNDKEFILNLAEKCRYSPGLLRYVTDYDQFTIELKKDLKSLAASIEESWEEFKVLELEDINENGHKNTEK